MGQFMINGTSGPMKIATKPHPEVPGSYLDFAGRQDSYRACEISEGMEINRGAKGKTAKKRPSDSREKGRDFPMSAQFCNHTGRANCKNSGSGGILWEFPY